MTQIEFFHKLGDLVRDGQFSAAVKRDGSIVLKFGHGTGHRCYSPLTAVCFAQTGRYFASGNWSDAAQELEIDTTIAKSIDDGSSNVLYADHDPSKRSVWNKLLFWLGLDEIKC